MDPPFPRSRALPPPRAPRARTHSGDGSIPPFVRGPFFWKKIEKPSPTLTSPPRLATPRVANAGRRPSPAACADATEEDHDATEDQDMVQLVLNLCIPELREKALLFLSKVNDPWSSRTPTPLPHATMSRRPPGHARLGQQPRRRWRRLGLGFRATVS